jgi:hypothetical protein
MIAFCPFQIFNLSHKGWSDPNTFFHVVADRSPADRQQYNIAYREASSAL